MKIVAVVLIAMLNILLAKNEIYNLVDEYRNNGMKNIQATLENYLLSADYWRAFLENKDTKFGYYESVESIFIASKSNKKLKLYMLKNGRFELNNQSNALFGANENDKKIQDDLATPLGVYKLNNKLENLDQYYGPLAFVTSYPNLYDRLMKKTGYGIWIHGLPLNGDRTEKATKGCIAIDNNLLSNYGKNVNYKTAILVTSKNELKEISKNTLAQILMNLHIWRNAWIINDVKTYLGFYGSDFVRFDGMKYDEFNNYKKRIFAKNEQKSIQFSQINISPYPNENNKEMYRITFFEDYRAKGGYSFSGEKELYIEMKKDKMFILVER